jgi:hypothetical protein
VPVRSGIEFRKRKRKRKRKEKDYAFANTMPKP